MLFVENHAQVSVVAPEGSGVNSWKVTLKRGTESGVGVSVSGAGGWAQLQGDMSFMIRHLGESKTYDMLKKEYNIGGGICGFWSWLGIGGHASEHKEEIHQVFKELANSQQVEGHAYFNLFVSGLYPNVAVDATAYVLILQVEDSSGNTFTAMSASDPSGDTGAQDQNGNSLPIQDNNSSLTYTF